MNTLTDLSLFCYSSQFARCHFLLRLMAPKMSKAAAKPSADGGYPEASPLEAVMTALQLGEPEDNQSETEGENTSSSEGETEDEDKDGTDKSRDGGDDEQGDGGDSPHDPDASASASAGVVPPNAINIEEGWTDPDVEELMEQVMIAQKEGKSDMLNLQDLKNLRKNCDKRATYYYKMAVEVGKAVRKVERRIKKEEKEVQKALGKAEEKSGEPTMLTINVSWNGRMFAVKVTSDGTVKTLRDLLFLNNPGVFTKKLLKRVRWMVGDSDLSERSRRTLGVGKTTQAGWKLQDGTVVRLVERGEGGAKRSRATSSTETKSKEIAMKDVISEIDQACLRFKAMGFSTPSVEKILETVLKMKDTATTNPDGVFSALVSELPEEVITRLQSQVVASSTKPYERVKKATEIVFGNLSQPLEEIEWQCGKARELLVASTFIVIMAQYGDTSGNLSWVKYGETLTNELRNRSVKPKADTD